MCAVQVVVENILIAHFSLIVFFEMNHQPITRANHKPKIDRHTELMKQSSVVQHLLRIYYCRYRY